jgi:large subunit ribosomal protein L31
MKSGIHPEYVECTVNCGCGANFTTRATIAQIKVEICSECHPFYTGKQKFVDTAGRVERFQKKYAWTGELKKKIEKATGKTGEEAPQAEAAPAEEPKAEAAPPSEEPKAEVAEEPKAEAPAEEPKAEAPAEDTPAEEAPAPEATEETSEG